MDLIIYGAQGYALGAYDAIKLLYPKRVISCFMVSEMGSNASVLGGLPVKEVADVSETMTSEEKEDVEVLIATPEGVQPGIEETLENYGFYCYQRLDSERWAELMKLFHARMGRYLPIAALPVGCHTPFVRLYMAKSHKDRPLNNFIQLPGFIFPIQVGADGCDRQIAELTDNRGKNISAKNGNYSELTALYWIWKNKLDICTIGGNIVTQYYGLVQYRRMFDFSEDDLLRLVDNDVDVVLPYPMPYEPNIHAHHERYLQNSDWNALLTALRELQPEYAETFDEVLKQRYLYNYNVILAKQNVLRDYCEWLFPILERTEELSVPKGSDRSDRYIGYMGETLETLYFMRNSDHLNIVHTGCKLLT